MITPGVLKEECERLHSEMLKAEEETQFTYKERKKKKKKKKGLAAEQKEAKLEKEEAEKYL